MTTLNLPFKRFVAQVSTGTPRIKSSYVALMEENLTALKACPWREADEVPVTLTPHDFMQSSYFGDAYDAFKMTGAYNTANMTEIGFAGMAAYRFTIPAAALSFGSEVALTSVALPVSRDKFLRSGVHIVVALSSATVPSTDWATIRGTGDLAKSGLSQADVPYLIDGTVGSESIVVDLSGVATNPQPYLWVYVTLEDYTDSWAMYDKKEQRLYAIEGSAMLVGGSVAATFAGDVDPDSSAAVTLLPGGSSPDWLQPLPTGYAGATPPTLSDIVETFFTDAQTVETALAYEVAHAFETANFEGTLTMRCLGATVQSISVRFREKGRVTWDAALMSQNAVIDGTTYAWGFLGANTGGTSGLYLCIQRENAINVYVPAGETEYKIQGGFFAYDAFSSGERMPSDSLHYVGGVTSVAPFSSSSYYLMLQLADGVPSAMDKSSTPSESGRQNLPSVVSGSESPWTITLGGQEYTVAISGSAVTLKLGSQALGTWTSSYDPGDTTAFDVSANLRFPGATAHEAVADYGLAAAVGDFSSAVATFEAGTQPANAELLGRLARMSRQSAGAMSYLHPAAGALADELDTLRPVPRFFRAETSPQSTCQPGLSAWYYRPSTGSTAAAALAYRDGAVSVVSVDKPVFLQLALLALRAPRAFENRIVIMNGSGAAITNGFALRFVAWRSPAADWDRSTSFALAAMATMPSVYRSDGGDSVTWTVDCNGSLAPFGSRTVYAKRLGASEVIAGDIDDGTDIEIVLSDSVAEGDVVLIAPEVVGFADGAGGASVTFGRQANPATAASFGAWARYACDLGWFPTVTGS